MQDGLRIDFQGIDHILAISLTNCSQYFKMSSDKDEHGTNTIFFRPNYEADIPREPQKTLSMFDMFTKNTDKTLPILGILGGIIVAGVAAKKFKKRPSHMDIPEYLVHWRVRVQATVASGFVLAVLVQGGTKLYNKYFKLDNNIDSDKKT